MIPKISIITPNYQSGRFLEACVKSVIDQHYPNLEYIIIDGGSTDRSVDIIKKYEKHLSFWVSEKDQGLYHALQKGFERSTGEIMGWLNADDLLYPGALSIISQVFQQFPQVKWLQGWPTVFDEQGRTVLNRAPINSKYFFLSKKYAKTYTFIQQESTYWHRSLWEQAGGYISTDFKLASDFELWMRFFQYQPLYLTKALIGGFRIQSSGQLSRDHIQEYVQESHTIIDQAIEKLSAEDKNKLKIYQYYHRYMHKVPFLRSMYVKKNTEIIHTEKFLEFDFVSQRFQL